MLVAYIDGGSRGNPGPAGFGVHVEDAGGAVVHEFCESVGVATNNVAEYRGLLAALAWAAERGERRLRVRSDSELLVRQMRGEYRVKNPGLQPLHARARALVDRFDTVIFEHVPRSMNREADRLANLAMDEAAGGRVAANGTRSRGSHIPAARPERAGASGTERADASRRGAGSHVPHNPAEAGSHVPGERREAGSHPSRQNPLPFDDHLPDNSPHSPEPSGPTRRTRRS